MKVLLGLICDAMGIAPATVETVVNGLFGLARMGHEIQFAPTPAGGMPDVARSILATRAMAGRFDVLLLIDSGACCEGSGVLDLCEAAHLRQTIVGAPLQPLLEREDHGVRCLGAGLTAYPVSALQLVAEELPKIEQGFYPFFVAKVETVEGKDRLCPGAWMLCLCHELASGRAPEVLLELRAAWAFPPGLPQREGATVRDVTYPIPRLPVATYLAELAQVAKGLRPDGQRTSLTEPPRRPTSRSITGPRIKVALVNTCMLAGGAERQTCTLAAALPKDRFDCSVVNANPDSGTHRPLLELLQRAEVPVFYGDGSSAITAADVVLWWGPSLQRFFSTGGKVKRSIHVAHSDAHWTAKAVSTCREHIDLVVGVSGPAAAMAADVLARPRESVPVVWNGIDGSEVRPPTRRAWMADGRLNLGWLGRLSDEKNPITVLAAVAELPLVRLLVWGGGPLEQFMHAAATELGVADRVEFRGVIEDRAQAFAEMDVMVLASLFEGLPLTVIEAMFAGVPVIAPPHGDLPLVLGSGSAPCCGRGLLADPDLHGITSAIVELVKAGEPAVAAMAARAQAFAAEHFTVDRMAESYGALIEELACRS